MRKKKKRGKKILVAFFILILFGLLTYYILYKLCIIPHDYYYDSDFGIKTYTSKIDKDKDGFDDQTDILHNAFKYIKTNPKYKSKYYDGGYPQDEFGVCTDVIGIALRESGYDLMELVDEDIRNNRELYNIDVVDKNIDFRRVKNLEIYFKRHAISLTTDLKDYKEFQGGDILIFEGHIGMVSNKRNKNGTPFLIHNGSPFQIGYEQDILEDYMPIKAHYRIS